MDYYNNNKIIAIGDIHGDYYIFIKMLKISHIINDELEWIGKDTYVVQIGDILDGKRPDVSFEKKYLEEPGELKIINLILKLDSEAVKQGGKFVSILGNHDICSYYFYKNDKYNKAYVKKSDIQEYRKVYNISRSDFFYPGKGQGAIIFGNTRPLLYQLGKFLFCHGSLSLKFIDYCLSCTKYIKVINNNRYINIDRINADISDWLITGNNKPFYIDMDDDIHPLLNRDLSEPEYMSDIDCGCKVKEILSNFYDVKYLILGHSCHYNINTICDNSVYRIDIGISRAFGGKLEDNIKRIQMLEIEQDNHKCKTSIITTKGKIKIVE
jgi:hypothetical protein